MLNKLTLTLQFGPPTGLAHHRAVLSRARVARWIRQALNSDAEITVRIVDEAEGKELNHSYRNRN